MNTAITVSLAGIPVGVTLPWKELAPLFSGFFTDEAPAFSVGLSADDVRCAAAAYPAGTDAAAIAFMELAKRISAGLLSRDACIFHGTAFLWNGKAWVFTAPSGTGKTTQYLLWKKLYGEEVSVLNGDKPILSCRGGNITVHPSPWRGKEGMGSKRTAPLGGVIVLAQRGENRISVLPASRAVMPLLRSVFFDRSSGHALADACTLADTVIRKTEILYLENRGDENSAVITHDYLLSKEMAP